ncbi:hypothetical protein J6590_009110 [Homalodisca vitripennis]|nr:hypothetical protein J6590_009110 [Homalodisca vitripennis]
MVTSGKSKQPDNNPSVHRESCIEHRHITIFMSIVRSEVSTREEFVHTSSFWQCPPVVAGCLNRVSTPYSDVNRYRINRLITNHRNGFDLELVRGGRRAVHVQGVDHIPTV